MKAQVHKMLAWPFRSLFWKLFSWFWLTMVSMMVALVVAMAITVDPADFLSERRALFRELEVASRNAERMAAGWSANIPIRQLPGSQYYLFGPNGESVGRTSVPAELHFAYSKTRDRREPVITFRSGVVVVGPRKVWVDQTPFDLYLTKEMPRLVHWRVKKVFARQWHLVIIALGVSFFLCIILASYLVVPIRQLQVTSRRLAQGDFTARVPQKVRERGDELGEFGRDFNHMAEQLEALINNKERLLRDVSHELRSPLTRLQLSLALAKRKSPDAESEHSRIEREIERLDQMVGAIIRFSRIQNGVTDMAWEPVQLNELIDGIVDDADFEAQAQNKSVVTKENLDIELIGVNDWLGSAIENMVRNAIRFTPEESRVEVSLKKHKNFAVVTVRDYGPGVPEDALDSMFEPFFRVDDTRGKENDGFGLGTSIAMGAVKNHGGTIMARNVHPGLEVTICLPLDHKTSV